MCEFSVIIGYNVEKCSDIETAVPVFDNAQTNWERIAVRLLPMWLELNCMEIITEGCCAATQKVRVT